MTPTMKRLAISLADRLSGALLISLCLRWNAQVRRKLRRRRAAA
jgi:hypothetical protein